MTVGSALVWLLLMLAISPVADKLATRLVATPPNLGMFRGLRQSRSKLIAGIIIAWVVGGCFEEIILRGIVLRSAEAVLSTWVASPIATTIAIAVAAILAALAHLYQGLRAAVIIAQLSIVFGLLFVTSSYDLWAVMLCHGLYDTIAFVRFANGTSRYAQFIDETP
jgi:uncharacterized protein